jgi:nicotinamidase-related amidase
MSNVVLVVDMLKGFLEQGHNLYHAESRRIIPNAQRLITQEKAAGASVLFVSDHHDPDDLEFNIFPVHCVIGTEETQVIPELAEFVTADNVIPKKRYSGFFSTNLAERLTALAPEKLLVCGVATNVCVLHTTSDARNRDYEVEVYSDCVSGPDAEMHRFALLHCQRVLGAKVI